MLSIARGAAFVVTQGIPLSLYSMPNDFKNIGKGDVAGIPVVIIIFVVFVILADFLMRRSTILRRVVYTGSSEKAALFSGINVRGREDGRLHPLRRSSPGWAASCPSPGSPRPLPTSPRAWSCRPSPRASSAGASLAGGDGSIIGSVFGIALLAIITTSMILLNVSVYWQDLVSGHHPAGRGLHRLPHAREGEVGLAMKGSKYLVGIDLGSTSLKSVIYDLSGNVVASGSRPTERFHPDPAHPDWTVWDPAQIWGGTAGALRGRRGKNR